MNTNVHSPEVLIFFILNSAEHGIYHAHNVKMSAIVGNVTFISGENLCLYLPSCRVCFLQPCGEGLTAWLSCMWRFLCFCHFPIQCLGPGVVKKTHYHSALSFYEQLKFHAQSAVPEKHSGLVDPVLKMPMLTRDFSVDACSQQRHGVEATWYQR